MTDILEDILDELRKREAAKMRVVTCKRCEGFGHIWDGKVVDCPECKGKGVWSERIAP